jgi:hypothetical protein
MFTRNLCVNLLLKPKIVGGHKNHTKPGHCGNKLKKDLHRSALGPRQPRGVVQTLKESATKSF